MLYMHPKITPCTLYWVRKRHWTSVLPASEVRPGCGWWSYGPRGPWRLLRGNEPLWSIQLARWTSSASCQSHWMDSVRDSQTLFSKSKKCWWKDFKLETLLLVTYILKMTLTGFPVSSSKAMKDLPMLISRDFLQMTPLSKQSTFSAATLSITSALLCGGEKTHNHRKLPTYIYIYL